MNSFMKGSVLLLLLAAVSINADDEHCGGLNKTIPAKDLKKLLGDWVLVWSASNHQKGWDLIHNLSSSHVELKELNDNITSFVERNMFVDKSCNKYDINMTNPSDPEGFLFSADSAELEKDGVKTVYPENGVVMFFESGENSMVMHYKEENVGYLMIYKMEGHHADAEKMKEDHDSHKKLAECMGFSHDVVFIYDGVCDFCHKKSAPKVAADGTAAPEVAADGTAAPEVAADGTAAPEVAADGTAAPEVAADGTAAPEVAAPNDDA